MEKLPSCLALRPLRHLGLGLVVRGGQPFGPSPTQSLAHLFS